MNVNWFTVIAQLVNFIILVWLLKKFLYKPVLQAIDAREKKITARLEDAKSKKEEAKKEQDEFAEKNKQFETQKKEMMDKAIADTKDQKDKLLDKAREDVDLLHTKQRKAVADMQDNLKKDLVQKTQEEVFDISRKALTEMASVSLEAQTTQLFISRLGGLENQGKQQFIDAFNSDKKPVLIQTAFDLPPKQQTEITKAVDEILGKEAAFEFKTAPEIISGISLTANGYKLSWNISAYLEGLQSTISQTIKANEEPSTETKKTTDQQSEAEKK